MSKVSSLLDLIFGHPSFQAVRGLLDRTAGPQAGDFALSGLTPSAKALVVAGLAHQIAGPLVVLTADNESADRLSRAVTTFLAWLGDQKVGVGVLPEYDCGPYEGRSPHAEIAERRAIALWRMARTETRVLFAPVAAALGRFREASFYRSLALELKPGDEVSLDDLAEHLTALGYERAEPVVEVGQFSVRGGIADVFPPEALNPIRIEFFGDQIESFRAFDPGTQRSQKKATSALLLPLAENARSPKLFRDLVAALTKRSPARGGGEPEWAAEYSVPFPGWEFFTPLAVPHPNSLLSLFERPIVIWDERLARGQQVSAALQNWAAAYDEIRDIVPPRPRLEEILLTEAEFREMVGRTPQVDLKELPVVGEESGVREEEKAEGGRQKAEEELLAGGSRLPAQEEKTEDRRQKTEEELPAGGSRLSAEKEKTEGDSATGNRQPTTDYQLQTEPAPKFHGDVKAFAADLRNRLDRRQNVLLVPPTTGKADRLREILDEYQIPFSMVAAPLGGRVPGPRDGVVEPPASVTLSIGNRQSATVNQEAGETPALPAMIVRGELDEGVVLPDLSLALISDADLFGEFAWSGPARRGRSSAASFISDLSDLKVGDYVVHVDHGVALYRGLRQIVVEGAARDFMLLTYQEEAKLYVPLERLDLVEKYRAGGDGARPVLDRLGGATWARTKTRVKRALRDMAEELLRIYAERKMRAGTAFSPDTPWQNEFESAFEFEETPHQLTALKDIKRDLESPQPMDRLLCGDVGYGKTELAMRAAFKVVQDAKQVAVLAPTTVLAFQHYNTFRQRMSAFPIRIEMLSRFRSPVENKKTAAEIEAGRVDIAIGTHRLLSKDVKFHDLGLLVVDEEQRFGVAAKEKLKSFKASVDVLTMSATPIPRTLNMSLGGLRDLSVIETPPRGRLAIQTVVAPFGPGIVQSSILEEMRRQGQVFFVHNRVDTIFKMAAWIQELVPTARIGVGHGQMSEGELEKVMMRFVRDEYDVLVSTVLIENGLDIPRANTLIVNHAERFGLADLYQLRGRVGRSNRRAYAYLLIPSEETLTPIAQRRLAALKEFSDLGAGFRLAALDLELRGAGNLLGAEQSGDLNSIGFDLYLKMLEEAVEELKGNAPKVEVRTTLNLGFDIKIPDRYIIDESQRLRMYKRISSLTGKDERDAIEKELVDRYGPIPPSVENLLRYALLKSVAEAMLVQSIERKADELWVKFHADAPVSAEKLKQFMRRHKEASLRPDGVLRFRLGPVQPGPQNGESDLPQRVQVVLQELHA